MPFIAISIFLSAFLLFQIQPMIGTGPPDVDNEEDREEEAAEQEALSRVQRRLSAVRMSVIAGL